MFDAVNGIARKYAPLRVTSPAPPGARADAAAAQAAYTTLVSLFPTKQAAFDAQLATSLAQISGSEGNSQSIAAGRTWGESVAQQILTWRANDGFSQVLTYTGSSAAGQWRHAPLAAAPAGGLSMTVTAPFALANPAAFVPGPPYGNADRMAAMATTAYAADVNEVKAKGGAVSTVRTAAQTNLALFINIADVTDINALVRRALPANAKLVDNARTLALLNIVANDATIVCFQTKYKYGLWRPLQAIPFADEDGNPATVPDPAWVPLAATPSHPEYLSGHALVSTAMLATAAAILGDDTTFAVTTSNSGAPAIAPVFASFSSYCDAVTEARINIGFHFRTACAIGQATGYAIAGQIVRSTLLPQPGSGMVNVSMRGDWRRNACRRLCRRRGLAASAHPRHRPGFGSLRCDRRPRRPAGHSLRWLWSHRCRKRQLVGRRFDRERSACERRRQGRRVSAQVNSLDAALLTILTPGSYTVHLSGAAGASGIALIEAYEVP